MGHRTFGMALIATMMLLCMRSGAQEGGDVEAQILYAYQIEAMQRLDELRSNLRFEIADDPGKLTARYHLAHADYRAALLLPKERKSAALEECIAQLTAIAKRSQASAETLALRGACYSQLASLSNVESVLFWRRGAADLAKAYQMDPNNPRIRLIRALDMALRPKMFGGDPQLAFAELKSAAELFDKSPATDLEAPGWGHADAYLELGLALQARRDVINARNALEKALLAAADSKRAQAALAALAQ